MTELEREVLDIINCEVEGCYIGRLQVKESRFYKNIRCDRCNPVSELYNIEYSLFLYLNADYEPMVLSYMFRERTYNDIESEYIKEAQEAFKEFIKEEFKNRKLQQVDYYRLILQLPSIDCNEQTKRDRKD